MENFWQWKLTKDVKRLHLKAGVIPHKYECQKKNAPSLIERKGALKRKRQHLVEEAIASIPSTSAIQCSTEEVDEVHEEQIVLKTKDASSQADLKKPFRSKGTNTSVETSSFACSPIKIGVNVGTCTSPSSCLYLSEAELTDASQGSLSDFEAKTSDDIENYTSDDEDIQEKNYKDHMIVGTVMSIEKEPKLFLGLPKKSFFLVQLLSEQAPLPQNHIYIVLKKIRLDIPFSILAIEFGLSVSTISRIFSKSLPILAKLMKELIVWPQSTEIQAHLPIPFRARYAKVISIIDCLEIEIEKPSDPIKQALTWSSYYHCNTLKYLVSCTPDGLVSFISCGYGGRASDLAIVNDSGYLTKLLPGGFVMADRGFKNISSSLLQRGCTLVRPPSVSASTVSTKLEVKNSKRIAALRIHVERVIGRLRDFKMLLPHACVDNHFTPILDFAVIVACGIINMQDHLIKKQI